MIKKYGVDIRNGNWLFYNNRLLNTGLTSPDALEEILSGAHQEIEGAATALYEKNLACQPDIAQHPWLHTIRLATYAQAFTDGLTIEAERTDIHHENNDYPRELIRPQIYPYLDTADNSGYVWRVPGRMSGWSKERDGLWLQVKTLEHAEHDQQFEAR